MFLRSKRYRKYPPAARRARITNTEISTTAWLVDPVAGSPVVVVAPGVVVVASGVVVVPAAVVVVPGETGGSVAGVLGHAPAVSNG